MTGEERERAIEFGEKWLKSDYNKDSSIHRFFTLALEALKAEPCDNATNGDVIRAMFPNAEIIMPDDPTDEVTVDIKGVSSFLYFDLKWWNASYKEVKK